MCALLFLLLLHEPGASTVFLLLLWHWNNNILLVHIRLYWNKQQKTLIQLVKMSSEQVCVCKKFRAGSEVTISQRSTCWTTCQVFPVISCRSQQECGREATSQRNWCRGLVAQMLGRKCLFSTFDRSSIFLFVGTRGTERPQCQRSSTLKKRTHSEERTYFPSKNISLNKRLK